VKKGAFCAKNLALRKKSLKSAFLKQKSRDFKL